MAFKSKVSASVGLSGSPTTITDTVASGATHTVVGLSLANTSASPVTTSVKLLKSAGGSAFLVKDATVAVGGALVVVGGDQKVCLETGDSITAYASAASSIDVALSYLV
jgi:hypothetical protein